MLGQILCSKELTAKELQKFRKAVKRDFYFQVLSARFVQLWLLHSCGCCNVPE